MLSCVGVAARRAACELTVPSLQVLTWGMEGFGNVLMVVSGGYRRPLPRIGIPFPLQVRQMREAAPR